MAILKKTGMTGLLVLVSYLPSSAKAQLPPKTLEFQVRDITTGKTLQEGEVEFLYNGKSYVVPVGAQGMVRATFNGVTGVEDKKPRVPNKYELSQNTPNPFDHNTTFFYTKKGLESVIFQLFNLKGALITEEELTGNKTLNLDYLPGGVYFARIKGKQGVTTRKIIKTSGGAATITLEETVKELSRNTRSLRKTTGYGKVGIIFHHPDYSEFLTLRRKNQGPKPKSIAQNTIDWYQNDEGKWVQYITTAEVNLDSLEVTPTDSLRLYVVPTWLVTNDTLMTKTWGKGTRTVRRDSAYTQLIVTNNIETGEFIGETRLKGIRKILESIQECLIIAGDTLNYFNVVEVDSIPDFIKNPEQRRGYSIYWESLHPPDHKESKDPKNPYVIIFARQRASPSIPLHTVGAELFGQIITNDGYTPPDPVTGLSTAYSLGALLTADGTASERAAALVRLISAFNPGTLFYWRKD